MNIYGVIEANCLHQNRQTRLKRGKQLEITILCKVSVLGVVALGGHFATLCRELDFYLPKVYFFITNFHKEKANTFTLLIILLLKSLLIELHSTNLLL